jgi:hypothetical protein
VATLFIEKASPWENGYNESFNGKLRDELLDREIFHSLAEARVLIERWRIHYNTERPHSSLGYQPPAPETIRPPRWPSGSAPLRLPSSVAEDAALHSHAARTTNAGQVSLSPHRPRSGPSPADPPPRAACQ